MSNLNLEDYETMQAFARKLSKAYTAIMESQKSATDTGLQIHEDIQALLPVLQSIAEMKHEIIVQPSGVTVEAAKVMMPEMPAPVVHVMEAEEHMMSYRFTFERDGRGFITGGTITPL